MNTKAAEPCPKCEVIETMPLQIIYCADCVKKHRDQKLLHDLGPLPTEHPRERLVNAARRDLADVLEEWFQRHPNLTRAEVLLLWTKMIHDNIGDAVWIERRPPATPDAVVEQP